MFLWTHESCDFGMFVPFLGVAFGVNILLSALNFVHAWLAEKEERIARQFDKLIAKMELPQADVRQINARREKCKAVTREVRNVGRIAGVVIAAMIALALLLIHPDQGMNGWGIFAVVLAGAAMPITVLAMVIVNRRWNRSIRDDITGRSVAAADQSAPAKPPTPDSLGLKPQSPALIRPTAAVYEAWLKTKQTRGRHDGGQD